MHKLSFVMGLLVGVVVATAWAQVPDSPGLDSSGHAVIVNPIDMMTDTRSLPVESHDAI